MLIGHERQINTTRSKVQITRHYERERDQTRGNAAFTTAQMRHEAGSNGTWMSSKG